MADLTVIDNMIDVIKDKNSNVFNVELEMC